MGKEKTTFSISKKENFSEWYTEILKRAEIVDIRYGVKGFVVIRPWGARILEKMYRIYESALQKTGHDPVIFPTVIPEENFKLEAGHVEGFTPEVFWLETKQGEERLALRPTSETAMYKMYAMWIRSHRDLPLKMYQRGNVFRYETKATRPLIRGREFQWLEAHDVFETKKEAEQQVQQDIQITESVVHNIFGIPFLPMKRPEWDKFPGADYTVGSDTILPDGKVLQLPSTHMLGQHFSKAFNVTYIDEKEKEQYAYQTCYGPGLSRILASIIALHGDDNGLILPYAIAPTQVVIVPFHSKKKSKKVEEATKKIQQQLLKQRIDTEIDETDKRPGEKFFYWEMKGVPFRIELGEKELETGNISLFIRDKKEKITLPINENIGEEIKKLGEKYDSRLITKANEEFKDIVQTCKTKEEIKQALDKGKIARFEFITAEKEGTKHAEYIEKELSARIMGTRADKKETTKGNCILSGKKATTIIYAGRSY